MKTKVREEKRDKQQEARVVLLEEHALFRTLLKGYIERLSYRVVGECSTAAEAREICESAKADLLICDLVLPDGCIFQLIRDLLARMPQLKVLAISGSPRAEIFDEAIAAGAHGFLHKTSALELIGPAIQGVLADGLFFGRRPAPNGLPGTPRPKEMLSERELEVLRLVAEAHSTKAIADKLGISARTADHHRTRIMRKLHIHDVVTLTRYALRTGVATLD